MAKSGTLKDPKTGEIVYPITLASNVYDENGNAIPTIYATKTELSDYAKEWRILWQNANTFSSFAGQTITTQDMSPYSVIAIEYRAYAQNSAGKYAFFNSANLAMPLSECYSNSSETQITYRGNNKTSNTTITIGTCYHNKATANERLVPITIWGIR